MVENERKDNNTGDSGGKSPKKLRVLLRTFGWPKISTDSAVDDDSFPVLADFCFRRLQSAKIPYCVFGHIAENHLHVNLMPEHGDDYPAALRLYDEFIAETLRLGGTVAAEHGIGKLKRRYLLRMFGFEALRQMAALKRAFDPALILGMGNIFEEKLFL